MRFADGSPMTAAQLADIVAAHGKWRRGEMGGSRANLAGANLTNANLKGANLEGANLEGADLEGADLTNAYLKGANLKGAYLEGAYLVGANLVGAYLARANLARADLAGANLARANLARADIEGANLKGANLEGAYLEGADLTNAYRSEGLTDPYVIGRTPDYAARTARYRSRHPEVPVIERIDARILDAITVGGGSLSMGQWHACATAHCRAGWAITIAGDAGKALEKKHGPARAGSMLYRAATGRVPHFYATDADALADIKARAAEQVEAETTKEQP